MNNLDKFRLKFFILFLITIIYSISVFWLMTKHNAFGLLMLILPIVVEIVLNTVTCPFCKGSLNTTSFFRVLFMAECCRTKDN